METAKEYSAGGVICKETNDGTLQVLLIRVRKNGFELPKGHVEKGETEQQAAFRECLEEVGITSQIKIREELGRLSYSFEKGEKTIEKNVAYFKFHCPEEFRYSKPKNTREIIWVTEGQVDSLELVNEALRPILEKAFQ